jgi:oligosaccharide repeat unit polymerase
MIRLFNTSIVPVFAIIVLIVTLVVLFGYFILSNDINALLCGVANCALMILILPLLVRRRYDLFEPLSFVILTTLIGVVLRTYYIVLVENENTRSFLMLGQPPEFLSKALLVISIALLFLVIGYSTNITPISLARFNIIRNNGWDSRRLFVILFFFAIITFISLFLYVQKLGIVGTLAMKFSAKRSLILEGGNYQYASLGYYRWGASLLSYVFYFSLILLIRSRRKLFSLTGIVVLLIGILSIIFPVLTSSRAGVLFHIINAILIWHYLKRPISFRILMSTVSIAVAIFILLTALRIMGHRNRVLGIDDFFEPEKMIESVIGNRNLFCVAKTAHILEAVPDKLEYQYGKTFLTWVFAPIPRTLWKEKPVVRIGNELGEAIFQRRDKSTGVPPGFIGELYMNFGFMGILIGMYFLGLLLKLLYSSFNSYLTRNINALLLYIFIVVPFAFNLLSGDFVGLFIKLVASLIPLLLILKFIGRSKATKAYRMPGIACPTQ